MKHALIISNDDAAARLLEDRLARAGFDSFERAWCEEAAMIAADQRRPDLVVVGERLDCGCPFDAARRICAAHDIPALFATTPGDVLPALPPDARLSEPFPLVRIEQAVRKAELTAPSLAA